jgi:NAD(P)-dependent dehydrogenase (short-subunit alcohol dehydrogenase family)
MGTVSSALAGKRIVIIGGTSGLGLSAAKAFISAGALVLAIGKDEQSVTAAAAELGSSARVSIGDAVLPDTSVHAIEEAVAAFGGLDGLYHVAGGSGRKFGDGPLHEMTDDGWRRTIDLNLTSVLYSSRAAVRQFMKQRSGGAILNLGSVLGASPAPAFFSTHAYATAKSGMIGFTRSCAAYYAPSNIRFNLLEPGLVETPMSQRAMGNEAIMAYIGTKQPLGGGRPGQPSDLDGAAVFFMSDASLFATGQVLAVDGGWSVAEGQVPAAHEK